MTKSELIDWISSVNRSATREFLSEFTRRELMDYMRQLESLRLGPCDVTETTCEQIDSHHAVAS